MSQAGLLNFHEPALSPYVATYYDWYLAAGVETRPSHPKPMFEKWAGIFAKQRIANVIALVNTAKAHF